MVQVDAYNGGSAGSTVTLSCAGQPTRSFSVAAGQRQVLSTAWTGTCTSVTVTSSNGWDTNTNYTGTVNVIRAPGLFRALARPEGSLIGTLGSAINDPTFYNLSDRKSVV